MKATLKYGIQDEISVDVSRNTLMSKQSVQEAIEALLKEIGHSPGELSRAVKNPRSVIEVKTGTGYQPLDRAEPIKPVLTRHPNPEFQINLPHAGG